MDCTTGYNPMQWNCETQGCFNLKKRPKIEIFAECFPGRIAMTDVDGEVEIGGNILQIEWKSHTHIPRGQQIKFERATKTCHLTVFVVKGDAETMEVDGFNIVSGGIIGPWFDADLEALKATIKDWAHWARFNQAPDLKSYFPVKVYPTQWQE